MPHKKKNLALTAALLVLLSCSDQNLKPTSQTISSSSTPTSHMEVVDDPTSEQHCYVTETEVEVNPVTGDISTSESYEETECPVMSQGSGQVSSQTCTMHFPANPVNGQKYVATGTCFNSAYYYSCIGSTWVKPADQMYGTPPANPYSGLRYQYDYTGAPGAITFIYLSSTGSNFLPNGWYVDVFPIASTGCGGSGGSNVCQGCIVLGGVTKSGYYFTFFGTTAPTGSVIKVTARPTSGSTSSALKIFSLTYVETATDVYNIVGTAKAPNGTTVTFNDTVIAP